MQAILFHSVLGLRPGVTALARHLSERGHPTVAPDLYGGRSTADVEEGFALWRARGEETVLRDARVALAGLSRDTVLIGVSAGAGIAGALWAERPAAAGVVFLSGPGPIPDPRPSGVPVQMHAALPDPFDAEADIAAWASAANAGALRMFRYPGVGHNFLDIGGPDFDAAAAVLCTERLVAFLDGL